ncbi:MAG: replication initiation protein [Paraclostridium sp.]
MKKQERANVLIVNNYLNMSNDIIMCKNFFQPREFILWLVILEQIQGKVKKDILENDTINNITISKKHLEKYFDRRFLTTNNIQSVSKFILNHQSVRDVCGKFKKYNVIIDIEYYDNELHIKFDPNIAMDILGITNNEYSTIDIKTINSLLKSSSCIIMYMLLCKFKSTGYIKISNSQLRNILGRDNDVEHKYFHRDLKISLDKIFNSNILGNNSTYNLMFDKNKKIFTINFTKFKYSIRKNEKGECDE